jgi:hypothetical protein
MQDWQVVSSQVTARLAAVDEGTAVAFAALTAERLMRLDPQRGRLPRACRWGLARRIARDKATAEFR